MKTPLTVAVAQLNCVVGDLSGNARRILDAVARAKAAGAEANRTDSALTIAALTVSAPSSGTVRVKG